MPDFDLSSEQLQMQKTAREFAANEIRPAEVELDKMADPVKVFASDTFRNVLKKGYELGFHRSMLPEFQGGLALDVFTSNLIAEELAWGGVGFASTFLVAPISAIFTGLFAMHNQEMVDKFVIPFAQDTEAKHIGAWPITEPDIGSDCVSDEPNIHFKTQGKLDGDEYVISGTKSSFVSNGSIASLYLTMVCVDPSLGMKGTAIFLIPADLPGVSCGKPMDKLGLRVLNQADVYFDSVRVPREYMLFPPGDSYEMMLQSIVTLGNTGVGILALGLARAALEDAIAYAKERIQGGKSIIEHQAIAMKVFDAFAHIEAARSLLWKVSWINTTQFPGDIKMAAAARVFTTNMAMRLTIEMIQVFGGYGISKEYPVEKYMRDAKLLQIMDGTNEMLTFHGASLL